MEITNSRRKVAVLTLVAVIAWAGVLLQFFLSIQMAVNNDKSIGAGVVAFLGYFTVLTNIFVALVSTCPLAFANRRLGRWLNKPTVLGSATTAIVLVGIAYHLLLRNVWAPEGLQWLADVILHYVTPAALFLYWCAFPPRRLPVWAPLIWCIYPMAYIVYAFGRGELLGTYPYYFIDVANIGYRQAIVNALNLLGAFLALGIIVYGIAAIRTRTLTVTS